MEIESFRNFCSQSQIVWSKHALERLQSRGISVKDVKNCIMNGEIIEEYPNDFPAPSALIYGKDLNGKIIHTVCGIDEARIYIISAYYPSVLKFEANLKIRRK